MKVQPYSHDEIIDWLENTARGRVWREQNIKQLRYVFCWAWLKSVPSETSHPKMCWYADPTRYWNPEEPDELPYVELAWEIERNGGRL